MHLDELRRHYGTWAEMTRQLNLGSNTYLYWQRVGYIPEGAQYKIERITNGLFKAEKRLKELKDDRREY